MIRIRGGVYDRENCISRIASAIRIDNYYYSITFSDRYRGTYRLVSTDTAAFVLTCRHVQGTYRDTYSSRYRLVRTSSAVRTPVRTAVRTD